MGICFSKRKAMPEPPPPQPPPPNPTKEKKTKVPPAPLEAVAEAVEKKQPVFLVTQNRVPAALPAAEKEPKRKQEQAPKKSNVQIDEDRTNPAEEIRPASQVRTSSCSKEELDAILIQCGRLSRSSSGKTSNQAAAAAAAASGSHRRYSGSKRSYDFDNDRGRDEGEEWEKPASKPSPCRRTPSRERDGAGQPSGSRERASNGGGGRRVSRSPGRRSEGPIGGDKAKQQQPAKMVSVPAREKSSDNTGKRASAPAATKRAASPRSRSPANPSRPTATENAALHHNAQPQSLSRSSSKKAEQSPHRRNPMAEIDDNTIKVDQQHRISNKILRSSQSHQQKSTETGSNGMKSNCVPEIIGHEGAESLNPRTITRSRSSRRSSRDLDHALGSYANLLLEDIQNYHQVNVNAAPFSLPACVSKACSILEAVADLNSSVSDSRSHDGEGSSTENGGRIGRRGAEPFVESEVGVKDDLMEPSLHKYVTVRNVRGGEVEPQESAGSNSFVGQPWAVSSPSQPNSAESTDTRWASESEEEQSREDARGRRMGSSAMMAGGWKRDLEHRQLHRGGGGGGGGGKGRALSSLGAAAVAASI